MDADPTAADALRRLLIGDAPWSFLAETFVRTLLVYALLLLFMRLMGRRIASQLSFSELVVILTLGAAIGLPLQVPDTGLLAAAVVLAGALIVQRGLEYCSMRSRRFEIAAQGEVTIVVEDGHVRFGALAEAGLSREKLFAALRTFDVLQLGQLRRVYLEASGQFSLLRYRNERPGLSLLPADEHAIEVLRPVAGQEACASCGFLVSTADERCAECGHTHRATAFVRVRNDRAR